jgi:ABC-type branched-subunit amino acid transport system ATPase component
VNESPVEGGSAVPDKRELILHTENLHRNFGGLAAVAGVSMSVPSGELRAVIGPNGAGKTSLFNLLSGRLLPSSGRIYLGGRDVTGWSSNRLARHGIARTFQITSVFPNLAARENVRVAAQCGLQGPLSFLQSRRGLIDAERRTDEILATIGLEDRQQQLARQLAYGDQRLLEIGIALATRPRLMMLDEPMAGMSPAETHRAAELIRSLAGGITVMLIEHDMDVVLGISDRVTVMHQGRVIAEGPPAEIRTNREVQDAYLGGAA